MKRLDMGIISCNRNDIPIFGVLVVLIYNCVGDEEHDHGVGTGPNSTLMSGPRARASPTRTSGKGVVVKKTHGPVCIRE
jgi:hypothetical protein